MELDEVNMLNDICGKICLKHRLADTLDKKLEDIFGERYRKAMSLIEGGSVKCYIFRPSGRVIWEVKGSRGVYQVMPHINFCSCDDYYFRVMDAKKQLCYHLIAQRLAYALNRFEKMEFPDKDYGKITKRWKAIK
jgi:predicted nucleic acid-binding Zn finger protein